MFQNFKTAFPKATYLPIRLIEPSVDTDCLVQTLCEKQSSLKEQDPVLLHIDTAAVGFTALYCIVLEGLLICYWSNVTFSYANSRYLALQVHCGLEEFLFRLLILQCLRDSEGKLWRRNTTHLIAVEALLPDSAHHRQVHKEVCIFLPSVIARLKSLPQCNSVLHCYKILGHLFCLKNSENS